MSTCSPCLEALVETLPLGIYVMDVENWEVLYANRELAGRMAEPKEQKCWARVYGQEGPCFFCSNKRLEALEAEGKEPVVETEFFNDVDDRWYQLVERFTFWNGRKAKYSVATAIDELKEAQKSLAEAHALLALQNKELEHRSETDGLTGLYNRHRMEEGLREAAARALRYGEPLSVVMTDLDHFKAINDTYGHREGDRVLKEVARAFRRHSRSSDLVGRWGGEEFLILCASTDLEGAGALARTLREEVAALPELDRPVTASFGVAPFRTGESWEELVERADKALYRAKATGRNRVVLAGESEKGRP